MTTELELPMGQDDSPLPPGTTDPLSPGRTDLNPGDKPGVDEIPDNEGETPKDAEEDANRQDDVIDVDIDNAEFDDQPNPR